MASERLTKLLSHDQLPEPLCSVPLKTLLRLGRERRFVKAVRITPHAPPLWPETAVVSFVETKVKEAATVGDA